MKWVDLRYRAEDSYSLPWESPEAFSFLVKSTDPWTVRSYNPDWCTITPAEGEGNPVINEAETFTVTVQYKDNAQLDDRVDTLEIKLLKSRRKAASLPSMSRQIRIGLPRSSKAATGLPSHPARPVLLTVLLNCQLRRIPVRSVMVPFLFSTVMEWREWW